MSNHQQPIATNIYKFPLIRQEDAGPKMNPMCNHSNNLQQI
jgi:hypothetical protein